MSTNVKKVKILGVVHDIEDVQARTDIGSIKNNISSLQNNMSTAQGNISSLKEDLGKLSEEMANKTGTGLSTEAIDKLEEVGNYLAYTTADGGSKWTELISILRNGSSGGGSGQTVTLQSISATYTGGNVTVGTSVTNLTGITVTGTYSDGSTSTITGYTLSGEIVEGSNTITVSYGGKTTTFTVTGVAESSGGDTTEAVNLFDKNTMVTELTVFHDVHYSSLTGHGSRDLVKIPIELSEDTWFCISNNSQPASTWKGYDPPQMMVASVQLTDSNNSDAFVRKYYLAWSDLKYDDNINGTQAQDANVITKDTTGVGVAFLVPSNAKYIYINMTHNDPEYWRTLMVEKGKTCHDYVDYVGV